jgi:hypothetical protein
MLTGIKRNAISAKAPDYRRLKLFIIVNSRLKSAFNNITRDSQPPLRADTIMICIELTL